MLFNRSNRHDHHGREAIRAMVEIQAHRLRMRRIAERIDPYGDGGGWPHIVTGQGEYSRPVYLKNAIPDVPVS